MDTRKIIMACVGFILFLLGSSFFLGALFSDITLNSSVAAAEAAMRTGDICAGGFLVFFGGIIVKAGFTK